MNTAIETMTPTVSIDTLIRPRLANGLGDILRRGREHLGLTREQLGAQVGLDFWGIKQIERGAEEPTYQQRRALAAVLGLDDDALRRLPIRDTPVGARRREDVELVATSLAWTPKRSVPGAMKNFVHVIVSHGETELRAATNLRLAMIDDAHGTVGSVSVMADEGAHWFTTAIHYHAYWDLFEGTDPDGETIDRSVPPEPDQTPD